MIDEQFEKITGVAVIIENKKGEFLLHLRDGNAPHMKSQWCLLGGSVKNNQTSADTAVREIKEEIGIDVDLELLMPFKSIVLQDGIRRSLIYSAVIDLDYDMIKVGEGKDFRFFPKDELASFLKNLEYTNPFLKVLVEFVEEKYGKAKKQLRN